MLVGVVLRLTRYLLRFPLWEDEAMLSANLLDRGYGDCSNHSTTARSPPRCSSGDN